MNISETLSRLADFLAEKDQYDAVQMCADKDHIYFEKVEGSYGDEKIALVKELLIARVPFASKLISAPKVIAIPKNGIIGYLATLFGYERLERICQKAQIDLKYRPDNFLCRYEIEAFCIYAAEVYECDLQELFNEIKSNSKTIRFLHESDSLQCRIFFEEVQCLKDCSNEHLDRLISLLVPHNSFFTLFSKSAPHHLFSQIWARVWFYEEMRRNPPSEYPWFMTTVKRIVDREITEEVVFRNGYSGFCKVHRIISEGGAFKCFLKHMGRDGEGIRNIVAYRGTCERDIYTFVDDLRYEFGSQGPKSTFEETHRILADPEMSFVKSAKEVVTGIGMSLGACHLMRDTLLFKSKIGRAVAFAGPGPDKRSMELFARCVNDEETKGLEIEHWWEGDDIVHYLGGSHLGAGCDPNKIKVLVNILEVEKPPAEESMEGSFKRLAEKVQFPVAGGGVIELSRAIMHLESTLSGPHCRNTLEGPYHLLSLNNKEHPDLVDRLLSHDPTLICDPKWEKMRPYIPRFIVGDEPFASYAEKILEGF